MEWDQYVQSVLDEEKCLNNIYISIDETACLLPSIVKASVFMLEKMIKNQGRNNLFVFPDGEQIPFLFMLAKLIYDIHSGKIGNQYKPEDFIPGQILKLGNCVVEFIKVGEEPYFGGKKYIYLKFADIDQFGCPIEMAPFFQKSDTKKQLSKISLYKKETKKLLDEQNVYENTLYSLRGLKTHVTETLFYVSSVSNCQKYAQEIMIDGSSLFDYFLVAQTDYTGELKNVKGKYVGTPALAFASQIDYVNAAICSGANVQSVIINLKECNIETQLAALDDLLQYKIPILCITDTANSFELVELKERKFNIWRWDEDSISENIRSNADVSFAKRIEKCVNSKVIYHCMSAPQISENFNILYHYTHIIENESAQINAIFHRLFTMSYLMLRNVMEINKRESAQISESLVACKQKIEAEKIFMDEEVYNNFIKVINNFEKIIYENSSYPKTEGIFELLKNRRFDGIYLICSNNDSPQEIKKYWTERLAKNGYRPNISVLYAKDFLKVDRASANVAIISGWLSATIIRKIIYGYFVDEIHIYTYECEERWKKAHTKLWRNSLNNANNKVIAEKSFANQAIRIHEDKNSTKFTTLEQRILSEQDDIELIMQENKYRQYVSRYGHSQENVIDAKPAGFAGGEFALFTRGHKILVVSKIIAQVSDKIEKKEIEELVVGDFIVVRESSKDIIREVADKILEVNKKIHLRKTAALWKEALKIESAFSTVEDIYNALCNLGCTKNIQTVRNWLMSEDIIIPQKKEDLIFIAQVTNDSVLLEKVDEIYDAGDYIQNVHIKAGRILSERLTEGIANKLLSAERIDPFNIWDPIELDLEEVGSVKVLKIIDLGQEWISVNSNDTNKILSEERESVLWQE